MPQAPNRLSLPSRMLLILSGFLSLCSLRPRLSFFDNIKLLDLILHRIFRLSDRTKFITDTGPRHDAVGA